MRVHSKYTIASALLLSSATALSNPYTFNGPCKSQGLFTEQALSNTKRIQQVAQAIKDDPNCKGLGQKTLSAIETLNAQIQNTKNQITEGDKNNIIGPRTMDTLRDFIANDKTSPLIPRATQALMTASLGVATRTAESLPDDMIKAVNNSVGAMSIMSSYQKMQIATKSSISFVNNIIDELPNLQSCLIDGSGQSMGQFLAGSIAIVAGVASGDQNHSSEIATLVSKLTNFIRENKYAKIIAESNRQELLAMMTCLLEVTSEGYCSADDMYRVFNENMSLRTQGKNKSQRMNHIKTAGTSDDPEKVPATQLNPFAGYYTLSLHVPNVTSWLLKIILGVEPTLKTDAQFQNNILHDVIEFQKKVKELKAAFNFGAQSVRALDDPIAKRNASFQLLQELTTNMTYGMTGSLNFFTQVKTDKIIPFYLIGWEEDKIPPNIFGKSGFAPVTWDTYLQGEISNLPDFKDPELLLEKIGTNLEKLFMAANVYSIQYYTKWFVVDKNTIVTESLTNPTYTVKDSLVAMKRYLIELRARISYYSNNEFNNDEKVIIVQINDTIRRIVRILNAYKRIASHGPKTADDVLLARIRVSEEKEFEILQDYAEFVNTVYKEFMVMTARTGFISNRMKNLVEYDYSMLAKKGFDFSPLQKELLFAAGQSTLERIVQMHNHNPASVQQDLVLALNIHRSNLENIGRLLHNPMVSMMARQKMIAENKMPSSFDLTSEASSRIAMDSYMFPVEEDDSKITKAAKWLSWNPFKELYLRWFHSDRYSGYGYTTNDKAMPDDEHQSAKTFLSQMCIQALAFVNQKYIQPICNGAILKSPFNTEIEVPNHLATIMDKDLSMSYDQKLQESAHHPGQNMMKRVCAFRDFNRKHLVYYLTLGFEEYQSSVSEVQ